MTDTQSGEESDNVTPTVTITPTMNATPTLNATPTVNATPALKALAGSAHLFDDPESVRQREQVLGVVRLAAAGVDFRGR